MNSDKTVTKVDLNKQVLPGTGDYPDLVATFEKRFADLVGVTHAITFSYARIGLQSILNAMTSQQGDEVILSPLTCKVVPLAILGLGLKPVYADISADTLNLDSHCVESAIGPSTRAVLFQHTYGQSAGVEKIVKLLHQKEILVLEDCAQCLPYATRSHRPGSWGDAAIFSNNLRKPLPAGSGGVVATNNHLLAQRLKDIQGRLPQRSNLAEVSSALERLAHKYFLRPRSYWPLFALNRKLSFFHKNRPLDLEIAEETTHKAFQVSTQQMQVGLTWLDQLKDHESHRRHHSKAYSQTLNDITELHIPALIDVSQPLYYFPVLVNGKDELLQKACRRYIEMIAWPIRTPIYPIEDDAELRTYGYIPGSCPIAEDVARRLVGLPTDHLTSSQHCNAVVALLKEYVKGINVV